MTDASNSRLDALTKRTSKLKDDATLSYAGGAIDSLGRQVSGVRRTLETLRSKGYAGADAIGSVVNAVATGAEQAAEMARARLEAHRAGLTAQAEALVSAQPADEAAIAAVENEAGVAEARLKQALDDVNAIVSPNAAALSALDRHLALITLGVEAWADFSGDKAGEYAFAASDAEWAAGKGRGDAPDGILYLTGSRLIFEQKEKVGKTLGFFGGKQVHEVRWSLDVQGIGPIETKRAGFFGGRDMLYINHGGEEYVVEVRGRANNEDWAAYITRAKAGQFPVAVDVPAAPDAAQHAEILARLERELAEWVAQEKAKQTVSALSSLAAAFAKKDTPTQKPAASSLGGLGEAMRKNPPADAPKGGPLGGGAKGGEKPE